MSIHVDIHNPDFDIPDQAKIQHWLTHVLYQYNEVEISIKIVGLAEMQAINLQYRKKDKPTNVLSFPSHLPEGLPITLLGDLVLCPHVIQQEALEQNKTLESHWAHMIVHGTLHLLGYDHEDPNDAQLMENLEINILETLGFTNPYGVMNE
tara:strand:- start:11279 stop:11731 length:453 start_codon:yes stop_codon:yes gene_type:complete